MTRACNRPYSLNVRKRVLAENIQIHRIRSTLIIEHICLAYLPWLCYRSAER